MQVEENESLGSVALHLFAQILLDYAATVAEAGPVDASLAIEKYLSAQPNGYPPDAVVTRLRALAEAVRDTVLEGSGVSESGEL